MKNKILGLHLERYMSKMICCEKGVVTGISWEFTPPEMFGEKGIQRWDLAADLVRRLREEEGDGTVWICGGADVAEQCLPEIDEFRLSVMPVLLGAGTPLFRAGRSRQDLHFVSCRQENGVVELIYRRRTK